MSWMKIKLQDFYFNMDVYFFSVIKKYHKISKVNPYR